MDFKLNSEQKRIVELVEELGREEFTPKAARWDKNHEYPWDNIHTGHAAFEVVYPLRRIR